MARRRKRRRATERAARVEAPRARAATPGEPGKLAAAPSAPARPTRLRTYALAALVLCAFGLRDAARVGPSARGPVRRPAGDAIVRAIGGPLRAIHGRVERTEGAHDGVPGASVEAVLVRDGRTYPIVEALSDAQGGFELTGLPDGSYELIARAPGLARRIDVATIRGGNPAAVALRLGAGARIEGTLTEAAHRDVAAAPLAHAVVRAMPDGGGEGPPFAVRTDASGAFVLDGLAPGSYRVEVAEPGFEAVVRRAVPAPAQGLALTVRQLASVRGLVRDGAGTPVPDASVTIAGSGIWPAREARARADGAFEIVGVPSGVYELRASSAEQVAEPIAPLVLEPGDAREVTLTVTPGATLEGVVVDARTQRAIADAHVVVAEDALATAPRALVADARGAFRVTGLLHRPHQVSARAPGYVPRVGALATPGGEPVIVALDRQVSLTGRVVDSRGAPVAGAQIEVTAIDLDGRSSWLTASAISFRDALFAAQRGGPRPLLPAGELGVMPGPVPVVPLAQPGGLPGTVFTGASAQGSGYVTDAQGRFQVDEVPPGVVTVSASHPAYVRGESAQRAARAGEAIDVEIVLHPGGTIDGRLLDEQGYPVALQPIEVRLEHDPMPRRAFSARDGTFRVPSVLGHVAIVALVGGRVGARAEADVADDAVVPVTLSLDRNARRVRGRVLDERGYPVVGVELSIAPIDASTGATHAITSSDGSFDVMALGAGTLDIEARHPDFALRTLRVADVRDELAITLDRGGALSVAIDARNCAGAADVAVDLRTTCGPVHRAVHGAATLLVEHLCPGRVVLVADALGCVRVERTGTIARGAPSELARVELVAGGAAQGDVVDLHGDPVAGATVQLAQAAPGATTGTARTDRRGGFAVADLPDGDQLLVAVHPLLGRTAPVGARIWRGTIARGLRLRFDRDLAGASRDASDNTVGFVDRGGRVEVASVLADSPAARAGLQPGDRVVHAQGQTVTSAEQATARVRGPVGDEVTLEVERDDARRTVRWVRAPR